MHFGNWAIVSRVAGAGLLVAMSASGAVAHPGYETAIASMDPLHLAYHILPVLAVAAVAGMIVLRRRSSDVSQRVSRTPDRAHRGKRD